MVSLTVLRDGCRVPPPYVSTALLLYGSNTNEYSCTKCTRLPITRGNLSGTSCKFCSGIPACAAASRFGKQLSCFGAARHISAPEISVSRWRCVVASGRTVPTGVCTVPVQYSYDCHRRRPPDCAQAAAGDLFPRHRSCQIFS